MAPEELQNRNFESEFIFASSRSSGPGGQNVNKVNTKVELRFNILNTMLFSEDEKEIVTRKLKKKINKEGDLILTAQSERTQLMNKKVVTEKFFLLISKALTIPVMRRSTRPTRTSVKKRLDEKRNTGLRKQLRKLPGDSFE
jgi:ribosome-associated protein